MSDGDPESGDIGENPEPEADAELSEADDVTAEDEREVTSSHGTDQPEDELHSIGASANGCESSDANDGRDVVVNGGGVEENGLVEQEEGEEAEGVVPLATCSGAASPQHQDSDILPQDHRGTSSGNSCLSDQLCSSGSNVSLGSTQSNNPEADEDEFSQGVVSQSSDAGSQSDLHSGGAHLVNGVGQIPEASDSSAIAADLTAPEDEASNQGQPAGDGQAPECDQDYGQSVEPNADIGKADEEEEDLQDPDESHLEMLEDLGEKDNAGVVEPNEGAQNILDTSGNAFQSESDSVGSSDNATGKDQENPDNVELAAELGVELYEDYSDEVLLKQESDTSKRESCSPEVSESTVPVQDGISSVCSVSDNGSLVSTSPAHSSPASAKHDSPCSQGTNKSRGASSSPVCQKSQECRLGDFEDDLLSELDAALHPQSVASEVPDLEPIQEKAMDSVESEVEESQGRQLREMCLELPNGLELEAPVLKTIQDQLQRMQNQLDEGEQKLNKLQTEKHHQAQELAKAVKERDVYQLQIHSLKSHNPDDLYLPQIKELEYTIAQQQTEIRGLKDKLSAHDGAAKRAVSTLQNELKVRVDQVTKMYEECVREKDTMVVKYAESEQRNIETRKGIEKLEAKIRESAKDREAMVAKVKAVKIERHKAVAELDAKSSELGHVLKEMDKVKEALSSSDVRIKWAQNKLKAELEAHKDTKASLDKTNIKLKEAREETQQIRRDCQAMIKTYQESEEIKSNSLDKELKVKESELIIQRQAQSDKEEYYQMMHKELNSLKAQHKETLDELASLTEKFQTLEEDKQLKDEVVAKYENIMQKQKGENKDLQARTIDMSQLKDDFNRAQHMIKTLDKDIADLMVTNKDLQLDMEGCRKRESELLDLTEKLSRKNAKLQSDNTNLNNQVVTLSSEAEKWKMEIQELDTRCHDLEERLTLEQKHRKEETESLTTELEDKTKQVDNFKQLLEDEKDVTRTLKRKHVNNIKDLTRQLQQARRKLETFENHTERDTTSMGSRTSSNGSLNTITDNTVATHNTNSNHSSNSNSRAPSQEQEYPVITEQVEVDKQVLIERIVRLQKAHARKNEKLEFLDDHIRQLVDEIKRKNKIIQNYVMREESGTLAPDYMDDNKALLAKKGGIMASVYSTHQQDGAMTLDLSLEINKKLQSVLEDTLLKNITLKENLDTLGKEISRLSQENRQLQLHIQQLPH